MPDDPIPPVPAPPEPVADPPEPDDPPDPPVPPGDDDKPVTRAEMKAFRKQVAATVKRINRARAGAPPAPPTPEPAPTPEPRGKRSADTGMLGAFFGATRRRKS